MQRRCVKCQCITGAIDQCDVCKSEKKIAALPHDFFYSISLIHNVYFIRNSAMFLNKVTRWH